MEKRILTNDHIVNEELGLINVFYHLRKVEAEYKFNYARKRNMEKLMPIMKEYEKLKFAPPIPCEGRAEYDKERMKKLVEICGADANGNPVSDKMGMAVIPKEKQGEWNDIIVDLYKRYPDVAEADKVNQDKLNEWLDLPYAEEFYKVKTGDIPKLQGWLFDILDGIMWDVE